MEEMAIMIVLEKKKFRRNILGRGDFRCRSS